jgi:hypothetical protein
VALRLWPSRLHRRSYADESKSKLKKELGELGPGSFGENLTLDGGADFGAGTLCIGPTRGIGHVASNRPAVRSPRSGTKSPLPKAPRGRRRVQRAAVRAGG